MKNNLKFIYKSQYISNYYTLALKTIGRMPLQSYVMHQWAEDKKKCLSLQKEILEEEKDVKTFLGRILYFTLRWESFLLLWFWIIIDRVVWKGKQSDMSVQKPSHPGAMQQMFPISLNPNISFISCSSQTSQRMPAGLNNVPYLFSSLFICFFSLHLQYDLMLEDVGKNTKELLSLK